MQKQYTIIVTGKVQGVWYRKNTREKALELGIKGFVKNQSDGSVFIKAEGEETQLRIFLKWCHKGSELAEVSNVSFREDNTQFYKGFEIL